MKTMIRSFMFMFVAAMSLLSVQAQAADVSKSVQPQWSYGYAYINNYTSYTIYVTVPGLNKTISIPSGNLDVPIKIRSNGEYAELAYSLRGSYNELYLDVNMTYDIDEGIFFGQAGKLDSADKNTPVKMKITKHARAS